MSSSDTLSEKAGQQNPEAESEVTRRDFLNEIAAAALGVAGLGATVVTIKYLSPNVLFEPPTQFRAGTPDDFPVNSVTYIQDQQVYIVRVAAGFYAVSAVCTHLGCITQWKPEDNLIECPCHGSRFTREGTKVAGPAPRPLPHFALRLTADGQLLVDKLEPVKQEQVLKV
jgi:cytochrome b6-f complex iron-sulfur subunit